VRQSVGPAEHVARAAEAFANCGVFFGWQGRRSMCRILEELSMLRASDQSSTWPGAAADPTSWLNQVELWFANIERDRLARGIFRSCRISLEGFLSSSACH
jgi:hypothetical protein